MRATTRRSCEYLYAEVNGQRRLDEVEERLQDNRRTPPDEQAAFRLDFAAWLGTLTAPERRLVRQMLLNHRTKDLACWFDVSPSRISQLRREFCEDWARFRGEAAPPVSPAGVTG